MRAALVIAIALVPACWISDPQEFASEYAESYCRVALRCDFDSDLVSCESEAERRWLDVSQACAHFDVGAARRCVGAWDDRVEDAICALNEPPDCLEVFRECSPGALRTP